MSSVFARHKPAFIAAIALASLAAAIPVTAFVIVPIFVRSTLVESAPQASASAPTTSATAGATPPPVVAAHVTLATGMLRRISLVHFGTGRVSILNVGQRFVRFENVEIAAAPAMHVYLSDRTDGQPGAFTDLGPLDATSGSFNYGIPTTVDLSRVKSVVVWCTQFSVTVTYAVLQPV